MWTQLIVQLAWWRTFWCQSRHNV